MSRNGVFRKWSCTDYKFEGGIKEKKNDPCMSYTYVSLTASQYVSLVIVNASPTPLDFAPSLLNALFPSAFHLIQRGRRAI